MTMQNFDHPLDVLTFIHTAQLAGKKAALVTVTETLGGSVRAPGALMAVLEDGTVAGYVSNGCVDGNLVFQAQEAMARNEPAKVRYGQGSPFMDIRLPCGGAIDLLITPNPDQDIVLKTIEILSARRECQLLVGTNGSLQTSGEKTQTSHWQGQDVFIVKCLPKLQIRIAGIGAEVLALTRLGCASGFEVIVQSPDENCLRQAGEFGARQTILLKSPHSAIDIHDDRFTAFVLMFHDHSWETELLRSALAGKAFYIGALGSRKTHAIRCDQLADIGVERKDMDRIKGPIGLVSSLRDASMVAISTLAEIIKLYSRVVKDTSTD
ncbi:XdhC family protein [Emcibacter sp.]|uniref:XdhC family protein n=1 Tax=Emcibacter sp. TaxID=1979954 RepID=UPI002AA6BBEC|nr:XdhC family protein [Emcibacter sp.]